MNESPPSGECGCEPSGFDRTDWLSCSIAFSVALVVYLLTLAPDVTLGFAGIFSVAAMHGGVPHPPGYPLFTVYAWLWSHVLPFGNIAWRVAVASAVAAASSCGLIALLVSRSGRSLLQSSKRSQTLSGREAEWTRWVCGCTAGLVFGFSGAFWQRAVIADAWPLTIFMLCLVFYFFRAWHDRLERKPYLYAAFFVYGLAFTNSQILLVLAPAVPFLVLGTSKELSRDLFALGSVLLAIAAWETMFQDLSEPSFLGNFFGARPSLIVPTLAVSALMTGILVHQTRKLFTEFRRMAGCLAAAVLGLSLYLYVPVVSMTNPPINWGYSRTTAGFFHTLSRGQYERVHIANDLGTFVTQLKMYGVSTTNDFGWIYIPAVLLPLVLLRRVPRAERGWLGGLLASYVCLAFLMLAVLNPAPDMQSVKLTKAFFSASYVLLAIWMGYGLAMSARLFGELSKQTSRGPAAP